MEWRSGFRLEIVNLHAITGDHESFFCVTRQLVLRVATGDHHAAENHQDENCGNNFELHNFSDRDGYFAFLTRRKPMAVAIVRSRVSGVVPEADESIKPERKPQVKSKSITQATLSGRKPLIDLLTLSPASRAHESWLLLHLGLTPQALRFHLLRRLVKAAVFLLVVQASLPNKQF